MNEEITVTILELHIVPLNSTTPQALSMQRKFLSEHRGHARQDGPVEVVIWMDHLLSLNAFAAECMPLGLELD